MSKNIFEIDKLKLANPFYFFAVVIVGMPSNEKNSSYYGNWFYLIWPKPSPDINIDDRYIKVYYLNYKSFNNFVKDICNLGFIWYKICQIVISFLLSMSSVI